MVIELAPGATATLSPVAAIGFISGTTLLVDGGVDALMAIKPECQSRHKQSATSRVAPLTIHKMTL